MCAEVVEDFGDQTVNASIYGLGPFFCVGSGVAARLTGLLDESRSFRAC